MGLTVSTIFRKEKRNLVLGLKGAGKTTVLCKLKNSDDVSSIPVIGHSIKTIEYRGICFIAGDVGNHDAGLSNMKPYFKDARSIIYVVDSNEREKMPEAREQLARLLNDEELRDAVLLVLCNKQDLEFAMSPAEMTQQLGLQDLRNRPWYIQSTCATRGDGLYEGFEWLSETLKIIFNDN